MGREEDGRPRLNLRQGAQDPGQHLWHVHVRRAVQRQQGKAPRFQPVPTHHIQRQRPLFVPQQRVNHHVAHKVDLLLRNALPPQVLVGTGLGGEEQAVP